MSVQKLALSFIAPVVMLLGGCALPLPAPPAVDCDAFVHAYGGNVDERNEESITDGYLLDRLIAKSKKSDPNSPRDDYAVTMYAENLLLRGEADNARRVAQSLPSAIARDKLIELLDRGVEAVNVRRASFQRGQMKAPTWWSCNGWEYVENGTRNCLPGVPGPKSNECEIKTFRARNQARAGDPWSAMNTFESIEDHRCHDGKIYAYEIMGSIGYMQSPSRDIAASALRAGDPMLACRALNTGEPVSRQYNLRDMSTVSGQLGHRALSLWLIGQMTDSVWRRGALIRLLDPSISP